MSPGVCVASAEAEQTGAEMLPEEEVSTAWRSCVLREELSIRRASLGP